MIIPFQARISFHPSLADDGVKIDAPSGSVVGTKAIGAAYAKFRAQYPEFCILKYVLNYKDMQTAIADEWAIEVGSNTDITYKMSANATPVAVPRTKGMRLLKRQSDGSWKFALCCWVERPKERTLSKREFARGIRIRRCSVWMRHLARAASRRVAPEERNSVSSAESTIISPSQPPVAAYNGYRVPRARLAAAHNGTREK